MYAIYTYKSTATAAQVVADVVAIVTGTTDVSTLSDSCDKPASSITSVIPAGWELHDASAGTNAICVKAPLADDITKYKYVVLDTNTSGYIYTKVYETWNASTHTGTNLCYTSDVNTYSQKVSLTAGGRIYIAASVRALNVLGEYGTTYGSSSSGYAWSGCCERSRIGPWDTVAKGFPPFFFNAGLAGGNFHYAPRLLKYDNTTLVGASAPLTNSYILPVSGTRPTTYKIVDDSGTQITPLLPIYVTAYTTMNCPIGNVSGVSDVWIIPDSTAAHGDVLQVGSSIYICFKGTNTGAIRIAVRGE
jgi:hypothetical protein